MFLVIMPQKYKISHQLPTISSKNYLLFTDFFDRQPPQKVSLAYINPSSYNLALQMLILYGSGFLDEPSGRTERQIHHNVYYSSL